MTGSDLSATLRAAAREAVERWRDLALLTAPSTWGWVAIPFLFAGFDAERAITPALLVGVLALTAPFGLLRAGLDGTVASRTGISPMATGVAVVTVGVPLLLLLAVLGGLAPAVLVALAAALAAWRLVPPLRALEHPLLEPVVAGAQAALIVAAGLTLGGRPFAEVPWLAALAFGAWSAATTALRAAPAAGQPWIAVAGYGVATVLAVATPGIGLLGGVAVALYLLLPTMVLLARNPGTARARAWTERQGLDALVGAWLVALLAGYWGIVALDPWTLAVVVTSGHTGLALADTLATRLATRRHRVRHGVGDDAIPSVTVVVSGRSDDPWLLATLGSVLGQTYADTTVLVVDGGLTGDGREEVARLVEADGLIDAPMPPADWDADDWARDVGARAATGDLLLFVGPGTVLLPIALRIMVEQSQTRRLSLLSAIPRLAMPSAGERAGAPGFAMLAFGFVPIWWSALTGGRPSVTAVADGGLLLVERAAYLAAVDGAHAGTPPRGGRGLARAVAARGGRVGMIHGASLAVRHLDRTTAGAVDRWRHIVASREGSIAAAVGVIALELAAFVAPLLLLPTALLGRAGTPIIAAATVPLVMLVLFRFVLAVTQRQPLESIAWHPVTVAVALVGQVAGIADRVRGTGKSGGLGAGDAAVDAPDVDEEVVHSVT